jgi:hypothetical protein
MHEPCFTHRTNAGVKTSKATNSFLPVFSALCFRLMSILQMERYNGYEGADKSYLPDIVLQGTLTLAPKDSLLLKGIIHFLKTINSLNSSFNGCKFVFFLMIPDAKIIGCSFIRSTASRSVSFYKIIPEKLSHPFFGVEFLCVSFEKKE